VERNIERIKEKTDQITVVPQEEILKEVEEI